MYLYTILFILFTYTLRVHTLVSSAKVSNCRDRSNHLRQDGELCFEIPPWQYQQVELRQHIERLRRRWEVNSEDSVAFRRQRASNLALTNSEITRYMDTVLAPYLDTYHRNIQNAYQQLTSKILRRMKEEINGAVKKKQLIYNELVQLADELNIPKMCDGERRLARTVASNHVALMYACTEQARVAIAKMGKYAEEMIEITKNHMQTTVGNVAQDFIRTAKNTSTKDQIATCLKELSHSAVALGYELDLSLTNARRHNEQSCEKLTSCSVRARKRTEDSVNDLRDSLYHIPVEHY